MLPLKWPKREAPAAAGVPVEGRGRDRLALRHQLTVAVSRPERCICQGSWSSTQPEYIAKRGTSGTAVSIDSDGRVHFPTGTRAPRPGAAGDRLTERSLQPEAERCCVDRNHDVTVGSHLVLDRAVGSRP